MKTFFVVLATAAMALAFPKQLAVRDGGNSGNQCPQDQQQVCCNQNGIFGFTCTAQGILGLSSVCNGQQLCCEQSQEQVGLINIGGCNQIEV